MENNKNDKRFDYTPEDYLKAKAYLESMEKLDYYNTHGFSCDGYSIVAAANMEYSRQKNR